MASLASADMHCIVSVEEIWEFALAFSEKCAWAHQSWAVSVNVTLQNPQGERKTSKETKMEQQIPYK